MHEKEYVINFFIKTWPDDTATLMTSNGQVLGLFHSLDDAVSVCREWYGLNGVKADCASSVTVGEDCYSASYM